MSDQELLERTTVLADDGRGNNAKALVVKDDGAQEWVKISKAQAQYIRLNGKRLQ